MEGGIAHLQQYIGGWGMEMRQYTHPRSQSRPARGLVNRDSRLSLSLSPNKSTIQGSWVPGRRLYPLCLCPPPSPPPPRPPPIGRRQCDVHSARRHPPANARPPFVTGGIPCLIACARLTDRGRRAAREKKTQYKKEKTSAPPNPLAFSI